MTRAWQPSCAVSIVVPAHDEARELPATLAALRAAAGACGHACEILVVDDASTDGTAALARAAGARVLHVAHRHIAATRNAGAAAAHGRWLVFVDADTHVPAATLRAALRALDGGAAGGGARVCLRGRLRRRDRLAVRTGTALLRLARIAPGCFMFCTREAFDAAGGFDERWFAGEDVAMSRALAKVGRFVLLHEAVWTSARKLETFTAGEQFGLMLRFAVRGRGLLRSREHLGLWYERREKE